MCEWQNYPKKTHDMETLSALLTLSDGNPAGTGGFPAQKGTKTEFWIIF